MSVCVAARTRLCVCETDKLTVASSGKCWNCQWVRDGGFQHRCARTHTQKTKLGTLVGQLYTRNYPTMTDRQSKNGRDTCRHTASYLSKLVLFERIKRFGPKLQYHLEHLCFQTSSSIGAVKKELLHVSNYGFYWLIEHNEAQYWGLESIFVNGNCDLCMHLHVCSLCGCVCGSSGCQYLLATFLLCSEFVIIMLLITIQYKVSDRNKNAPKLGACLCLFSPMSLNAIN